MAKLTATEYPTLVKAVVECRVDAGILNEAAAIAGLDQYELYSVDMNIAEAFLKELTPDEFELITCGDQDEAFDQLGARQGWAETNRVLEFYFDPVLEI